MNYRIGIRTQKSDECLVQFTGVTAKVEAGQTIGQKVVWQSQKTRHIGNIVGFHGKNGVVIVRFKKGVPGQAIGDSVELISRKTDLATFFRDYYFCTNQKYTCRSFFQNRQHVFRRFKRELCVRVPPLEFQFFQL